MSLPVTINLVSILLQKYFKKSKDIIFHFINVLYSYFILYYVMIPSNSNGSLLCSHHSFLKKKLNIFFILLLLILCGFHIMQSDPTDLPIPSHLHSTLTTSLPNKNECKRKVNNQIKKKQK